MLHLRGDVAVPAADDPPVAGGLGTAGLDPGHEVAQAAKLLVVVAEAGEPGCRVRAAIPGGRPGGADPGEQFRDGGNVGEQLGRRIRLLAGEPGLVRGEGCDVWHSRTAITVHAAILPATTRKFRLLAQADYPCFAIFVSVPAWTLGALSWPRIPSATGARASVTAAVTASCPAS